MSVLSDSTEISYLWFMRYLPIGRQSFKEIIQENLLYVDKTQQVYQLITRGKLYFLSRPRRFGKTLNMSIIVFLWNKYKITNSTINIIDNNVHLFTCR